MESKVIFFEEALGIFDCSLNVKSSFGQQLSQVLAALKTSKMNFPKLQVLDLVQDGHGYAVMMEN